MTNWETILETDSFIVDYDKTNAKYRVSSFEDNHFVDDVVFDACETVVHGMWIFINEATSFYEPSCGDTCKCSECQYIIDVAYTKFNYCPNCGAKMDKDIISSAFRKIQKTAEEVGSALKTLSERIYINGGNE